MRVVQAGDGLGLALEPLLEVGVSGDVLGEDFDGDGAVEAGVGGFVHFAHTACPDRSDDLVGAELRACLRAPWFILRASTRFRRASRSL